jgi:hypothetical protein
MKRDVGTLLRKTAFSDAIRSKVKVFCGTFYKKQ